jgi:hypothetical protein
MLHFQRKATSMIGKQPNSDEAPALSTPIEVPEVTELSGAEFDVVAYAHFLLTHLLRHDTALLHGQFQDGTGIWLLRQRTNGKDGSDVAIARLGSKGDFRMVLARFGFFYMSVQLYGGFAHRVLIHRGCQHVCNIYMSNDNWTGYWIRVYARALIEP